MRTVISIFLISTTALLISQTKPSDAKVIVGVDPVFNKITVKLNTDLDSLTNCIVQILDSKKNIIKTVELPKATKQTESSITILDLPGNYTCLVYHGKVELYNEEVYKDAVFMEPQIQPVLREPQN